MKLYADAPTRRTAQLTGDVLLLVWVVGWVLVARAVHGTVMLLARPGGEMRDAGNGLAARLRDAGAADLDLFALRALGRQPLHRLAAISDDPAGAWRARQPDVVRRLALLELADAGLRPPG